MRSGDERPRIGVISPYASVRAGLRTMLEEGGFRTREAATLEAMVGPIDGALIDGASAIPSEIPTVYLLDEDSRAPDFGARPGGWIRRDSEPAAIVAAVSAAIAGLSVRDPYLQLESSAAPVGDSAALSAREFDVLRLLGAGLANKEIAARLDLSVHTVKFHLAAIMGKLGAASRTEAVAIAIRRGLLAV